MAGLFNSTVLDVAIGLVFVYLLLANSAYCGQWMDRGRVQLSFQNAKGGAA
jgi:hypothetical protein